MQLHTNKKILSVLLLLFSIGIIALGILSLSQFDHPLEHFRDLVLHDRIVQMIMFDFLFFFTWVFLWMIDRGQEHRRMVFPWLILGILAASWMILVFIVTERKGGEDPSGRHPHEVR